jgi:uncharacterized protein (DUF2225 family)
MACQRSPCPSAPGKLRLHGQNIPAQGVIFYGEVLECERSGSESIEDVPHHGPDLDNNYGFDGVLYLLGVLLLKYGQSDDAARRIKALRDARSAVSRIVGMGQSSKSKPSALLDLGRELHKKIKTELEALSREA